MLCNCFWYFSLYFTYQNNFLFIANTQHMFELLSFHSTLTFGGISPEQVHNFWEWLILLDHNLYYFLLKELHVSSESSCIRRFETALVKYFGISTNLSPFFEVWKVIIYLVFLKLQYKPNFYGQVKLSLICLIILPVYIQLPKCNLLLYVCPFSFHSSGYPGLF